MKDNMQKLDSIANAVKITWIVLVVAIPVIGILWWYISPDKGIVRDQSLIRAMEKVNAPGISEPGLLYVSIHNRANCDKNHPAVSCYSEMYVYLDGRYTEKQGRVEKGSSSSQPTITKRLSKEVTARISQKLTESNILTKNCPIEKTPDDNYNYQVNINDIEMPFSNPAESCKAIFDEIDGLILNASKN